MKIMSSKQPEYFRGGNDNEGIKVQTSLFLATGFAGLVISGFCVCGGRMIEEKIISKGMGKDMKEE